MKKEELKLIVALNNVKVGRGVLTLRSALLIGQKLQQSTVEEFAEWLSANADKLRMRIIHEHPLDIDEIDIAIAEVAERLLDFEIAVENGGDQYW